MFGEGYRLAKRNFTFATVFGHSISLAAEFALPQNNHLNPVFGMQFLTFSVRNLLILGITFSLCSFRLSAEPPVAVAKLLEGKWACNTKSGQLNDITSYEFRCGGDVVFHSDHRVESATSDVFLPTGSNWEVESNQLVLLDSGGAKFVAFDIKKLEQGELVISRKGVDYSFEKIN